MSVSCWCAHIFHHGSRLGIHMRNGLHPWVTTYTCHHCDMYQHSTRNNWALRHRESRPIPGDNYTPARRQHWERKTADVFMWKCFDNKLFCDFNYPWTFAVSVFASRITVALENGLKEKGDNNKALLLLLKFSRNACALSWLFHRCFFHLNRREQRVEIIKSLTLPVCSFRPSSQFCIDMFRASDNSRSACCNRGCKLLVDEKRVN